MVTRRDIIGGIAGILAARQMPAMPIGARSIAIGAKMGGTPTARDYVQNGLISMWDGIENVGFGKTDYTSTVWKDLSPNGNDATLMGEAKWEDSALRCNKNSYAKFSQAPTTVGCVELVIKQMTTEEGVGILSWNTNLSPYGITTYGQIGFQGNSSWGATPRIKIADVYNVKSAMSFLHPKYGDPACFLNGSLYPSSTNTHAYGDGDHAINSNWNNVSQRRGSAYYYCIRIYSRHLTAAEVASNYTIDKSRFCIA